MPELERVVAGRPHVGGNINRNISWDVSWLVVTGHLSQATGLPYRARRDHRRGVRGSRPRRGWRNTAAPHRVTTGRSCRPTSPTPGGHGSARSSMPGSPASIGRSSTAVGASRPSTRGMDDGVCRRARCRRSSTWSAACSPPARCSRSARASSRRRTSDRSSPVSRCGASCSRSPVPAPTSRRSRRSAERDGERWVVNGQKVWCSNGRVADRGIMLARTDPTPRSTKGISFFLVDMHAPGVDVRPLRQMNGQAEFDEVFLTDVALPARRVARTGARRLDGRDVGAHQRARPHRRERAWRRNAGSTR